MELVREVDMWLSELRAVFRRQAAFGWFVLSIWAFLLHFDGSGLSSLIRYFGLASSEYYNLLHFFHSSAFGVQELSVRWAQLLLSKAPVLHLEGQPVYVVDGLVAGKAGKKMPGVKMLCTKPRRTTTSPSSSWATSGRTEHAGPSGLSAVRRACALRDSGWVEGLAL